MKPSQAIEKTMALAAELGGLEELESIVNSILYEPELPARSTPARANNRKSNGKRHRASGDEVQSRKDEVMAAVKKIESKRFTKTEVQKLLGHPVDSRTMNLLIADGLLTRKGIRRGATYAVE